MNVGLKDPKEVTMSTMLTLEKWQSDYLDLVQRVEDPVVRFAGRMAGSVAPYVPEMPTAVRRMPTMTELVENGLKFRKRTVDQQALFVRHLMKAMHPMIEKFDVETVATPTPKPHVERKPVARSAPRRMTKVA
jgi:hypothetical protein